MIIVLLFIFLINQITVQPGCNTKIKHKKIFLTQNQTYELRLSTFINGFNLSYSLINKPSNIDLITRLNSISKSANPCAFLENKAILANTKKDSFGNWQKIIVVTGIYQNDVCIARGQINSNSSITFIEDRYLRLDQIVDCLNVFVVQQYFTILHCFNQYQQLFLLQKDDYYDQVYFTSEEQIVQSKLYFDDGLIKIASISKHFLKIYVVNIHQNTVLIQNTFTAQDFQSVLLNLTDILIQEQQIFVLADYDYGFYRFEIQEGKIVQLQKSELFGGSFCQMLSGSSTQNFFFLSEKQISEVVWIDSLNIVTVYQLPTLKSKPIDLKSSTDLILLCTKTDNYIYKRGQTYYQTMLAKLSYNTSNIILINPIYNNIYWIKDMQIQVYDTSEGFLKISNLTEGVNISLIGKSIDNESSLQCRSIIELGACTNLGLFYQTQNILQQSYTISLGENLIIPLGKLYYGINLTYNILQKQNLKSSLKQIEKVNLFSIFSRKSQIYLYKIDSHNFYRLTTEKSNIFIQKCTEQGNQVQCILFRSRILEKEIAYFNIFPNYAYQLLFTYMLADRFHIYIQNVIGKEFQTFCVKQIGPFYQIQSYTLNEQYIFITHKTISRIDIYSLDFKDYTFKDSITNKILSNNGLFKPRSVQVSREHHDIIFVRNIDSIIIISFSGSPHIVTQLSCQIESIEQKWNFAQNEQSLIIIYGSKNKIVEYSIMKLDSPLYFKKIPLMMQNLTISNPINFSFENFILTIITNNQAQSFLTVITTGKTQIESIILSFKIESAFITFNTIITQEDNFLIFYQLPVTFQTTVKRIYVQQAIQIIPIFADLNQFVQKFPIDFEITCIAKQVIHLFTSLTVINYGKQLKLKNYKNNIETLPFKTQNYNVTVDDVDWLSGPICSYQVICQYCPDKIKSNLHFRKEMQSSFIKHSKHFIKEKNLIYALQDQTLLILDQDLKLVAPPILGIHPRCLYIIKNQLWLLIFCLSNINYFLPISMDSLTPTILDPIYIDSEYNLNGILKSEFISEDIFIILNNDITATGIGDIIFFAIQIENETLKIRMISQLNYSTFGIEQFSKINSYQIITNNNEGISQMYLTLENFGVAFLQINFTNPIQYNYTLLDYMINPPAQFQKYLITDNSILQIKLIGNQKIQINSTHFLVYHTIILLTSHAAHFELSLKYIQNKNSEQMIYIKTTLIQAFNRYGLQRVLNWIDAKIYDQESDNNMFLVAYNNVTKYTTTIAIYPLVSNNTQVFIKRFQNIKGGFVIESNTIRYFNCFFYQKSNGDHQILLNILTNDNQIDQDQSRLARFSLFNKLKFTLNYDKPPSDKFIQFYAKNDYSQISFSEKIKFEDGPRLMWYYILLICCGVVGSLIGMCGYYRRYRIRKQNQKKQSLISEQIIDKK